MFYVWKEKIKKFKSGVLYERKNSIKKFFLSFKLSFRIRIFKLYEENFVRIIFFIQYTPDLNFLIFSFQSMPFLIFTKIQFLSDRKK